MPPQMADHSTKARKRMRTSLKMEEHAKQSAVQPLDSEEPAKPDEPQEQNPAAGEAAAAAMRALADQFHKKPAEREPTDTKSNVTQLMSRFAPNTGQPQPAGPVDNSGQTQDQRIRDAVQKAVKGGT